MTADWDLSHAIEKERPDPQKVVSDLSLLASLPGEDLVPPGRSRL